MACKGRPGGKNNQAGGTQDEAQEEAETQDMSGDVWNEIVGWSVTALWAVFVLAFILLAIVFIYLT
jgi:hypothetical protein